jgi:hypothetical protein
MDRELLYRVCRRHRVFLADRVYGAFRRHNQSKSAADILPFSREFSKLYLLHLDCNRQENRKRRRMARYHRARGYIKYAKSSDSKIRGAVGLAAALLHEPLLIFRQGYMSDWLALLGMKSLLKPIWQALRFNANQ